ncbi:MAG TPA: DEAD/DEAH box helicase [Devosiaceae bacterium]
MDVFNLDHALIEDYERFARSFTQIRSNDIRQQVDAIYASRQFWPEPLISINPHFRSGATIENLVADGSIAPETGQIFRVGGKGLTLHLHQSQAVAKAAAKQSFVVTTGTGSGKSLCFFVPIIDQAIRARKAGENPRTKAIVVYPMNALANSQMQELEKFIEQSELPLDLRPTYARYTGQETQQERDNIRNAKPDILLTNFMMLELLMTRQNARDRDVIAAADGLDFIVLDELHTYRGRQGADVAMLIRRVRERLCREKTPTCIGTSATMASEGGEAGRKDAVAQVASRLFGADIGSDAVIDESLKRATDDKLKVADVVPQLAEFISGDIPNQLTDEELRRNPLAVWIELAVGLEDGVRLTRRRPRTVEEVAEELALACEMDKDRCREHLQAMLTLMSFPEQERGGEGDRAFMAFKLHRFISGAGTAYATLRAPGQRRVTLDGQQYDPEDKEARLYSTHFCRSCGQEYHPIALANKEGMVRALPRSIDDTPIEDDDEADVAGYLMPIPVDDPDFAFFGQPEDYPEEWLDFTANDVRIKSGRRKQQPQRMRVSAEGHVGVAGHEFWFIPGKFRFCLACKDQPAVQAREINKLAGLSAEGRSSATTLLVGSALHWMNNPYSGVEEKKRKLLGFTDNRQDAALQAGHFNDTQFVSLLRAAILAAVKAAGPEGLSDDQFGRAVQNVLRFTPENVARRTEWMADPNAKGVGQQDAGRTLTRVLSHRVWADQRRGWRFTNPNLEDTGLIHATYVSLDELVADDELFEGAPEILRLATPQVRKNALTELMHTLRGGLAVTAEALEYGFLETVGNASRQYLRDPWSIGRSEQPRTGAALLIDAPRRQQTQARDEPLIIRGGPRSGLARRLVKAELWGRRLSSEEYLALVHGLLAAAETYGLVRQINTAFDVPGWQLEASAVRLKPSVGRADGKSANSYFTDLYTTLAQALLDGGDGLFGLEGREHTAQVDAERREWREWRFRWGEDDQKNLIEHKEDLRKEGEPDDFLPVLFCSPTMELGVDISALNAVYLRNVPPTPANYAQRSGRAGRSGQAALVVTYCAAQSPHDQYYFSRPVEMVSGIVRPPALDLANRDLVTAHLHAIWLAEAGRAFADELPPDIPHILDVGVEELPVARGIAHVFAADEVAAAAKAPMIRVLESIADELPAGSEPWASDLVRFADDTAESAFSQFSAAFRRWRELYSSAHAQLKEANKRSEQFGLGADERRQAKIQHAQASEQITLLERGSANGTSDFYSYRYLATEGFLPGYNFPRLPLYAFVPSSGYQGGKGAFLQRARFLAIAEFGPGSLIYHEGRAYRVHKARLPAGLNTRESGRLATDTLYVCDNCGAAHRAEPERCHACGASMGGSHPIRNVLRIDNVETQLAERITANDEERQRRGYEIQTLFSWPVREGAMDVVSATANDPDGIVLQLDYANGTEISRVNKGLRRRRDKAILGFKIDPATGSWVGNADETDESSPPDQPASQRVVPIVQDHKNAALLRLAGQMPSAEVMATLQHALARGLDLVFQLEESEALTEPTPTRDNRKAILLYEAAEGGAGVLGRLLSEPRALADVARAALELMHYDNIAEAIDAGDPSLLTEKPDAKCVKACYRCLLSYYNQPDHELIDRTDEDVLRILLRLARCEVRKVAANSSRPDGGWIAALERWRLPQPDDRPVSINGREFSMVWRSQMVVATEIPPDVDAKGALEAKGFMIVDLPDVPGEAPPSLLVELLRTNG